MILKDLIQITRHKEAVIASLCLPFVLFGILAFSFSNLMQREADISPISVAVVDEEKSVLSGMLLNSFNSNEAFNGLIKMKVCSLEEAQRLFDRDELTAIIQIPDGFSDSILYLENYPLTVTLNPHHTLKSSILRNMLQGYGKFISSVQGGVEAVTETLDDNGVPGKVQDDVNYNISTELVLTALGRGEFFEYKPYVEIPSSSSAEYFIIAIIVLLLMYIGVAAGNFMISEKKSGCLARIKTTPVDSIVYVLSKLLAFSIYCMAIICLFVLPILLISGNGDGELLRNLFLFTALASLFVVAISILLSTFFSSEETFILVGNMFVFGSGILGGCFIPLQLMPVFIQNLAKITPNYWIIRGAMYLMYFQPLSSIINIIASLTGIAVVSLVISAAKVRRGEL